MSVLALMKNSHGFLHVNIRGVGEVIPSYSFKDYFEICRRKYKSRCASRCNSISKTLHDKVKISFKGLYHDNWQCWEIISF